MKNILLTLFIILINYSLFAQVEDIKKKSNQHKQQRENTDNNNQDNNSISSSPGDECANICFGACFDLGASLWMGHAKFLSKNKQKFPNLFSLQLNAETDIFPSNDLYIFHPSIVTNWSIIGLEFNKYRLFQQDFGNLSIFDSFSMLFSLNIGLVERNSLQFSVGSFYDQENDLGNLAWAVHYTWFSPELKNSIDLKYTMANVTNIAAAENGIIFIDTYMKYKRELIASNHFGLYANFGFNYQNYYDTNLYLIKFGFDVLVH